MKKVKGRLVEDIEGLADQAPGSFEYYEYKEKIVGLIYVCPCGCKAIGSLNFKPAPSPSWEWDGRLEEPTLSPSIHHKYGDKTHWHGYLRKGVWEEC